MASIHSLDKVGTTPAVSSEILDRLPPHSLEAEKAVIGSLLLDPELCDEVAMLLRPEEFYADAHQKLYQLLLAMHNDGRRIDELLLIEELKKTNQLAVIGGVAYLAEIAQSAPTAAFATQYAQIVQSHATLRSLIHASTEILRESYNPSLHPQELLQAAEEKIFAIQDRRGGTNAVRIEDVLHQVFDRIDARTSREHQIGVPTGLTDLDNLTDGLQNSELIILAARPSMGKTALATNIVEFAAVERRVPSLFVSLEMSALELGERLLCSRAQVDSFQVRKGLIGREEQDRLVSMTNEISNAPLFIDDHPGRTMAEIGATARRLKRRDELGLVVIDYLQLIEPDNPRDPRQEQVARIARRLKRLAKELEVPVLCLAQLNRQAEVTKDNRPRLNHLRESGAIEQDADVVLFVHREEYYHSPKEVEELGLAGKAEVLIAKQRNGPTGEVELIWDARHTRFRNRAAEHYDFGGEVSYSDGF